MGQMGWAEWGVRARRPGVSRTSFGGFFDKRRKERSKAVGDRAGLGRGTRGQ